MTFRFQRKSVLALLAATLFVLAGAVPRANASGVAGVRSVTVPAPERGAAIDLTLWYPALPEGTAERVGASPVFQGVPARRGAPPADGRFPVVLLAHGGMRAVPHLGGWIAARLAARGFIVVAAHPPPLAEGDARRAIPEIWLRPADLSVALTSVERDPALSPHIAPGRVGAVGFFLGGTSVLALAGARLDAGLYRRSCEGRDAGADCAWFARNGVDPRGADLGPLARSHRDPRVGVAVAVHPELSRSFTAASLADIAIPVGIISLGPSGATVPGLEAAGLEAAIPGARHDRVPDASPFSAFGLCTPDAADILRDDGDDGAICRDHGGRPRDDLHAEIAAMVEAVLARGLAGP